MSNTGDVKIADFGLSIDYSASSGRLHKPVTTLLYRAPEQVFNVRSGYDMSADVWSLGCVFAELLICEPLFCAAKNFAHFVEILLSRFGKEAFEDWPEVQESEAYQEHKTKLVKDSNIKAYIKTKKPSLEPAALDLLSRLLTLNPANRMQASDILAHEYFSSEPLPCPKSDLPKIELECHEYTIRKAYMKKKMAAQARLAEKQAGAPQDKSGDAQAGFGGGIGLKGNELRFGFKRSAEERAAGSGSELKRLKVN